MVLVDLGDLCYFHRIVAVVTDWMVRVRDADIRIDAIALLARELERDDARDVRLKGENLEVEHELRVVGERRGHAYRPLDIGRLVVRHRFLTALDLTLHPTYAVEILIKPCTIGNAHALPDPGDVRSERIQQARPIV